MMEERADTIIVSKCMEFRIKPTREQKVLIWKTFGCNRFVWNHLLDERISYEKMNRGKLLNTTPAHLKKENPFLCEVDSMALINTQLNLNQSCRLLFAQGKAPRFRAKEKDKRSYTTNWINSNIEIIRIKDDENHIKLPKLGRVRIILHRSIPDGWRMKNATIKETASGKFFISLTLGIRQDRGLRLLDAFSCCLCIRRERHHCRRHPLVPQSREEDCEGTEEALTDEAWLCQLLAREAQDREAP